MDRNNVISLFSGSPQKEVTEGELAGILKESIFKNEDLNCLTYAIISHKPGIWPEGYKCILDDIFFDQSRRKDMAVVFRRIGPQSHFRDDFDLCITPISDFRSVSIDPIKDGEFQNIEKFYAELSEEASDFLVLAERVASNFVENRAGAN